MTYLEEQIKILKNHYPEVSLDAIKDIFKSGVFMFAWMKDGTYYGKDVCESLDKII